MQENAMVTVFNIAHFRNIHANEICRDVDIYSASADIPNPHIQNLATYLGKHDGQFTKADIKRP
jgi:hypothetical protein